MRTAVQLIPRWVNVKQSVIVAGATASVRALHTAKVKTLHVYTIYNHFIIQCHIGPFSHSQRRGIN